MNRWANHTFSVALGASLLLHAGGVSAPVVYEWWTGRPAHFFFAPPPEPPPRKMPIEFVDAPDEALKTEKAPETNKISSQETVARSSKPAEQPSPVKGPTASVVKEAEQLAKKNQPDRMVNMQQGTPGPKQDFITPEEPLPQKKTAKQILDSKKPEDAETQEQLEQLKKKLADLEEMKSLLEEMKEKKFAKAKKVEEQQKQEEQKKQNEALKEKKTPPGNAPKTAQEQIFNPIRNLDTYQSQEIQKFMASAVNVGEASFDAKQHVLGAYLKRLKSKIAPMWRMKLESQTFGSLLSEKKVVIGFKITSDGKLAQVLMIEDNGDDLFNQICIQTIKDAAPYEPVPVAWMEQSNLDYLNLIYTFVVF